MFQLRKLLSQNIIKTIWKLTPNIKNAFILAICCLERRQGWQAGYLWNKKLLYSGFKKGRLIYSDSSLNDRVSLKPGTGKGELMFRKNLNFYASSSFKIKKKFQFTIFSPDQKYFQTPRAISMGNLVVLLKKTCPVCSHHIVNFSKNEIKISRSVYMETYRNEDIEIVTTLW